MLYCGMQGSYQCPSELLHAATMFIYALWKGRRQTAMTVLRQMLVTFVNTCCLFVNMKHILQLASYYTKKITSTQPDIFILESLPETFIIRGLFSSSSSYHNRDVTWQEIGRTCGSAYSFKPSSRFSFQK